MNVFPKLGATVVAIRSGRFSEIPSERGTLPALSLATFAAHPFFGVGYSGLEWVGGHSAWFDGLALFGLVGFGFYLMFVLGAVTRLGKEIRSDSRDLMTWARMISFLLYMMIGFVDPVIFVPQIMLLLFVLVLSSEKWPT